MIVSFSLNVNFISEQGSCQCLSQEQQTHRFFELVKKTFMFCSIFQGILILLLSLGDRA